MDEHRRRLLALLGTTGATSLAGCGFFDDGDNDDPTEEQDGDSGGPGKAKLAPEDGDRNDLFGDAVGVSSDGTTAVIGARFDEDLNGEDGGSAYVFQRGGGEWREETKLMPEDGDSDDRFGYSVGVSSDGTTAVISASHDEDPNGEGAGSVYVFPLEE